MVDRRKRPWGENVRLEGSLNFLEENRMSAVIKNITSAHQKVSLVFFTMAVMTLGVTFLDGMSTKSHALTGSNCIVCHTGKAEPQELDHRPPEKRSAAGQQDAWISPKLPDQDQRD